MAGSVTTNEDLFEKLSALADKVVADKRWQTENDDLAVEVFGTILYGYALAVGRFIMLLDDENICTAVTQCLVERVGVAKKWATGLVEEAARAAFDEKYHPGHHKLVGVGHEYMSVNKLKKLVDNVFGNIEMVRNW